MQTAYNTTGFICLEILTILTILVPLDGSILRRGGFGVQRTPRRSGFRQKDGKRRFVTSHRPSSIPPFQSQESENSSLVLSIKRRYYLTVPSRRAQDSRNSSYSLLRLLEMHCQDLLPKIPQPAGFKLNILEIASDIGEVTALALPLEQFLQRIDPDVQMVWQPSERSALQVDRFTRSARGRGIAVGRKSSSVRKPIVVDTAKPRGRWIQKALSRINAPRSREELYSVLVTSNLIQSSPWRTFEGLLEGAQRLLEPNGLLAIHGSYSIDGVEKRWSVAQFKQWLYSKNPCFGVHDLRDVLSAAEDYGFRHLETLTIRTPASYLPSIVETALDGETTFISLPSDDFIMILSNDFGRNPHINLPNFKAPPQQRSSLAQAIVDQYGPRWEELLEENWDDEDDDIDGIFLHRRPDGDRGGF
eukprot:jgi/Bigna1/69076/fgenesh1_pg.7_\